MKRIVVGSGVAVFMFVAQLSAQDLRIQNDTKHPLTIMYSTYQKPAKWSAYTLQSKVKVLPGKTVTLGDTKKTMVNEVKVVRTSALEIKPRIDRKALSKALKEARNYRKTAITVLFSPDEKGNKIFTTAVPEEQMEHGTQAIEAPIYKIRPVKTID